MSDADSIDILLATFNGAKYLPEQLASIEAQTHGEWHLVARDDGSSDDTPAILEAFRARHPERVTLLHDADGNLGLVANFSRLMEASTAPYAALCDQDDVWLPDKLALTLARMRELESEHGPETPLLVFTDLEVVDEELNQIHESFWVQQRLDPGTARDFSGLLFQNVVAGCASLANRALLRRAAPLPPEAGAHDWWLVLVAAAFGRLEPMHRTTLRYRQHRANETGARLLGAALRGRGLARLAADVRGFPDRMAARFARAAAFRARYGAALAPEQLAALDEFLAFPALPLALRLRFLRRKGLAPSGWWRAPAYALAASGGRHVPRSRS